VSSRPRRFTAPPTLSAALKVLVLAALAWLGGAAPAEAQGSDGNGFRAEARLGPRVVRPDGTVRLEIEIEGPGIQPPRLRPRFELENLALLGGPDQEHGLQMGTGGASWRYSWTWYLRPGTAGQASVTSIRVLVGDRVLELAPQHIRVAPGGYPGAGSPFGRQGGSPGAGENPFASDHSETNEEPRPVFLRAEVDPPHPYVGQRTLYTTYLYFRVRVRAIEQTDMPTFDDCWAESAESSPRDQQRVEVDGVPYTRVPIVRRTLYPLHAGTLELGAMRLRLLIERIERRRMFFGPVWVPDKVVATSNRIELPVRPLPEPATDLASRFHGAVGPLAVTTGLDRTEVAVGQGATLTVVIRGEGHLSALRPPVLDVPEGIDVIGPQSAPTLEMAAPANPASQDGRSGQPDPAAPARRAWRYVLVPRHTGSWDLPPVEVAYFDPATARYRVASSSLPSLVAHPPGQRLAGLDGDGALHSIRSAALPGPEPHRWSRLLPWAFGLPWLLAFALFVVHRSGRSPRRLPGLRRLLDPANGHRPALERLRAGVGRAAAEDRPRRAGIGLERAWRSFLGEAFGVPDSVPASGWSDALADRGVPPTTRRQLTGLVDDLHYLRYAPELSDIRSVTLDLADRSIRLAGELLRDAAPPDADGAADAGKTLSGAGVDPA